MTEELPLVRLTVRSASVYSLHSSKGTLRENRHKMKLHPEQKRFFGGGRALLRSPTEYERDDGRKRQKRVLGAAGAVQTKVEVEDRSVGSAVGTVQVWMGHKRLKKGRFPPRRQRAADPLLQLQADEKVEERGGGRAGGQCRGV